MDGKAGATLLQAIKGKQSTSYRAVVSWPDHWTVEDLLTLQSHASHKEPYEIVCIELDCYVFWPLAYWRQLIKGLVFEEPERMCHRIRRRIGAVPS